MIDRHARDIAAAALWDLLGGSISNDEYERRYAVVEDDRALGAIFTQVWFLYSDIHEHKLTGEHAPTDNDRALLERCVLFLRSDLEYEWPRNEFRLWYGLMRLLGLGRTLDRSVKPKWSLGDEEVWPFLKKDDYVRAGGPGYENKKS